jgi:hypothetical protein
MLPGNMFLTTHSLLTGTIAAANAGALGNGMKERASGT